MMVSQPSSPVLKAQRQRHELHTKIFYVVFAILSTIWFCRYVLLEDHPPIRKDLDLARQPAHKSEAVPASPHLRLPVHPALSNASPLSAHGSPPHSPVRNLSNTDTWSLGAVILVTQETISDLDTRLRELLSHSGNLTDIILLAPPHSHFKARQAVQSILSDLDELDVEISIKHQSSSLEPGFATIQAAQTLSTDWVLLLDQIGLGDFGPAVRDALLLGAEPPAAMPIGPRGMDYHLDGVTCISTISPPRRAAYLVPPLVLPASLLPPLSDSASTGDAWAALGDHVSRSELSLSGGLVISSSVNSSDGWCSHYAPVGLDGARLPTYTLPRAREGPLVGNRTTTVLDDVSGTVLFIAHGRELSSFFPIACSLLKKGNRVTVSVYEGNRTTPQAPCELIVVPVSRRMSLEIDHNTTLSTTDGTLGEVDVVISTDRSWPSHVLTGFATHHHVPVHVRIPQDDLPYIDWMVSLDLVEWKNWHLPKVELSVITNDRPRSLDRLLKSLTNARYFGDKLNLRINLEQTADAKTLGIADEFSWEHGSTFLHHRAIHGGLLTAVVESWFPHGNHSYGLILEDDVELSPLFYAYLKMSLLRYRYGKAQNRSPNLYGISLYQQKNLELHPEGRHPFDARAAFAGAGLAHPHTPYLSQIPCSWGALYFPEHWREFHAFLAARLAEGVWPLAQPVVPRVRSNRWTRSWKRFFIELVFLRGYVMLYPNYPAFVSLSTNHLEVGSHVRDVPRDVYLRKKKLFNLPLMPLPPTVADGPSGGAPPSTGLLELPGGRLPAWETLPVLDLLGAIVDQETISHRGAEQRVELTGCDEPATEPHDVQELLCTH
ncbi:hypothetical protein BD413DRAFT_696727 [Trametes elegans]|nr:hypothetical protein BD413DRAFT_696727 [Trametes elegans]